MESKNKLSELAKKHSKGEVEYSKPYLGGHRYMTHTDDGVLTFLSNKFNIKSVIDIGCGPGGMKTFCSDKGISWTGVDGDKCVEEYITYLVDFKNETLITSDTYDLAWSVEFLEHVYEEYQTNYMKCFEKAKYVFCTAAPPGKPGHHHVNCRTIEYWIDVFEKYGFKYDHEITMLCKEHSTMEREFVQECGLFFYKI